MLQLWHSEVKLVRKLTSNEPATLSLDGNRQSTMLWAVLRQLKAAELAAAAQPLSTTR